MDMSEYTGGKKQESDLYRLKAHCLAIRRNKDILAAVFGFLTERPPNASAAQEAFEEMDFQDKIDIWSVSPTAGGIWTTEERRILKTGLACQQLSLEV